MSTNKMATKADLQEMYQRILPYLGGGADGSYSSAETLVGTWTDGKPIYRKIITGTTPSNSTQGTDTSIAIAIGASVDTVIRYDVSVMKNGVNVGIPAVTIVNGVAGRVSVSIRTNAASSDPNNIQVINSTTSYNSLPVRVILYYTKV